MVKFYSIAYQHSPMCREKTFVCCVKVEEGENGEDKARDVLWKHRGKVFYQTPREITKARARQLCPSLFVKKPS